MENLMLFKLLNQERIIGNLGREAFAARLKLLGVSLTKGYGPGSLHKTVFIQVSNESGWRIEILL